MQLLAVDQIEIAHMLFMPVLLVPLLAEAQCAKLPQLFLLHLPRHAVLYSDLPLFKDPFVQPSQLQLQDARLRPLPTPVQQLLL